MQPTGNPFAFKRPITPDNLDELFAHHRAITGGWRMEGGTGGDGGGSGDDGGAGGDGGGSGDGGGAGSGGGGNALDEQGKDLGYPKDTPTTDMTDAQRAAYWQHQSKKHEGRYKNLAGDRSFDDVRKDLAELEEIRKQQQTPAEQALNAARDEGKQSGIKGERQNSARAIFKGALEAAGVEGERLATLTTGFNPDAFIGDDGVDTTKLTSYVKELAPAGTANQQQRRRDFGGGDHGGGSGGQSGGSIAQIMAERRAAREKKN